MSTVSLLREAEAGSSSAGTRLSGLCGQQRGLFLRLLPIVLRHIHAPVPSQKLESREEALGTNMEREFAHILPQLIQNWPFIHNWCCFFLRKIIEPDIVPEETNSRSLVDGMHQILRDLTFLDSGPSLQSFPGLLALSLGVWMHNVRSRHFPPDLGAVVCSFTSSLRAFEIRNEFLQAMAEYSDSVPLVLSELVRATKRNTPDTLSLWRTLNFITGSALQGSAENPGIRALELRFHRNGVIPSIIIAISRLLRSVISENDRTLYAILTVSAAYLNHTFQTYRDVSLILQALESDWLEVLARALPLAVHSSKSYPGLNILETYDRIVLCICQYLDHPRILRAARKWYRKSKALDILGQIPVSFGLHTAWRLLHESLEVRMEERTAYKHEYRLPCSNEKNTGKGSTRKFATYRLEIGEYCLAKAPKIEQHFASNIMHEHTGEEFIRASNKNVEMTTVRGMVTSGEYGRILFVGLIPDRHDKPFIYLCWGRDGVIDNLLS
ncbi:hypothetical protein C8J56DRAFT_1072359 [Mycena floridula]|nr:hypothetical protein C8J56DRAFT_1072359 [Mycena floridula]